MKREAMDAVFKALAHPERRQILDILKQRPGCCVNEVCVYFDSSRIAVMKHLQVLERARLIHSEKTGRERKLFFNSVPIQMIYDRWTDEFSRIWASQLTRVKYRIENPKAKERK